MIGNQNIISVLKTAQIISGCLAMEDLLRQLMKIVIENSGSGRGCLLIEKNGKWFIEAEMIANQKIFLCSVDIEKSDSVSTAVIRHVIRSSESVVLDDALEDGLISGDPYVNSNRIRSVFCMPLINNGNLTGIIYLENNFIENAFTPESIKLLQLLSGNVAVALENALLYRQARQEITELKATEAETQIRYEVSKALSKVETEDEVLNMLMNHSGIYPEAMTTICTFESGRDMILRRQNTFNSGITETIPTGTHMPGSTYTGISLFSPDKPFVSNNIYNDDRIDPASLGVLGSSGVVSIASFPLSIGNEWIGFLGVHSRQEGFFDDTKLPLYQMLVAQGSVAMRAARMRENIRDSQQRLSLLVQQSPLGIIEWDMNYNVVSWNPAAVKLFGYTEQEALKQHFGFLVPEKTRSEIDGLWQTILANKDVYYIERNSTAKDGRVMVCEWFNTSLVDTDGQIIAVVSLVQDITYRKRVEEELAKYWDRLEELVLERTKELQAAQEELLKKERLSVLGRLTATVSHELRNPLGVLRSSAFYLKEKIKTPDAKINKHLNRIEYQIDLCNSIVEELLEYTRGSNIKLLGMNIISLLYSVLDDVRHTDEIVIKKDIPEKMPDFFIDPVKMRRVVTNLVTNAIHAVNEKKDNEKIREKSYIPEVLLKLELIENEGDMNNTDIMKGGCRIIIQDNGIGMDEITVSKAFDPLFTTKARGTGLGLSIVKKIMEEHNGTITLESKIHEGTRAILFLPSLKEPV